MSIARARTPVGVVLLDKPAGPSSFALVADLRRRTAARTGHTGTLDPFATGLLVLLSGAATRLAPCFSGLDKRYVTDIDLTAISSTGDPTGELGPVHEPPTDAELETLVDGLRGEVTLPVPAFSAVKIDGERSYKLARQGTAVEMPMRTSTVFELNILERTPTRVRLEAHVNSGTYIRALAEALRGHCTTLRRTAVGPFGVDEATDFDLIPPSVALARLPEDARAKAPAAVWDEVMALERAQ